MAKQLDIFSDLVKSATICNCCGGRIKYWRKPLVGSAVAELIKLYKIYLKTNDYVHITKFSPQRSNFYTLQYWGLVKNVTEKVEKKRSAGLWMPTELGIAFIKDEIQVQSHAITKNNKLVNLTGKMIGVKDALRKKFDYDELFNYIY